MISLNKPFIERKDLKYFYDVLNSKILTDGKYQMKSENFIKSFLKSRFVAVTHSCTAALEISALLLKLKKGDEVLMPSYGFVSISNAITLRGAKPIFVDVNPKTLNICTDDILKKITKKTVAIYLIHYSGHSCDMKKILSIKKKYKLFIIEDAAHAFPAKYKNKYLGTIGDIGVFSFHETKNLTSGQGGCISINNKNFMKRVNHILDKGTNRKDLIKNYKKKIIRSNNKKYYSWVDFGSEYRASELTCALLYSQLKKIKFIQRKRQILWNKYKKLFKDINSDKFYLIEPLKNTTSSYHLIVLLFKNLNESDRFKDFLQKNGVAATFHYVPLHSSKMGRLYSSVRLPMTENLFRKVVRLPLFPTMRISEFKKISKLIKKFFNK